MGHHSGRDNHATRTAAAPKAPLSYCVHDEFEWVSDFTGFVHTLQIEELKESSWHWPGSLFPEGWLIELEEAIQACKIEKPSTVLAIGNYQKHKIALKVQ